MEDSLGREGFEIEEGCKWRHAQQSLGNLQHHHP